MKRLLLIALLVLTALPASATDFAGHHLLIPVAGRTPGAFGSNWKTDLVVTNAARKGEPVSVQIFFIVDAYIEHPIVANLWPNQSVVLADVVRSAFKKEQATGLLLIATKDPDAKITARARIYNVGSANGQYGQTVQAIPLTKLSREAVLTGLTAVDGNRTNMGIANPHAEKAAVSISVFQEDGEFRGSFTTEVGPYGALRINDVFNQFQTGPLHGATIRVHSSRGVYPYASVVRNDTGDADFIAGSAAVLDDYGVVVAPSCGVRAAQLSLAALPAEGWSVIYKPGVNPFTTTAELESRIAFKAKNVYGYGVFFTETLTPGQIAALRCEPSIHVVEQNGFVPAF